jgi:hypothetical protein
MAYHRVLGARIADERQVVRAQRVVETRAARRRGIDAHRRGSHFSARAVAFRLRQRLERVGPIGMEVHMAVPDVGRLQARPCGDELVVGEARRQRRAARIREALLGPVAPGGGAEDGAGRAKKT